MTLDRHTATKAAQLLSWLCTDKDILVAARLPNTVTLLHMQALKHFSRLLDPEPALVSGTFHNLSSLEHSTSLAGHKSFIQCTLVIHCCCKLTGGAASGTMLLTLSKGSHDSTTARCVAAPSFTSDANCIYSREPSPFYVKAQLCLESAVQHRFVPTQFAVLCVCIQQCMCLLLQPLNHAFSAILNSCQIMLMLVQIWAKQLRRC